MFILAEGPLASLLSSSVFSVGLDGVVSHDSAGQGLS